MLGSQVERGFCYCLKEEIRVEEYEGGPARNLDRIPI